MSFDADCSFISYDEVLEFLNELEVHGLYNDYMNSLFEFFRVKSNILKRKK